MPDSSSPTAGLPVLFVTEFTHVHVFATEFVDATYMNEGLTTTGITPVTVGSTLKLQLVPTKNHLPWDLLLASVMVTMTDPDGLPHSYQATVDDAGVTATLDWTVPDLDGLWRLAWDVTDADGVHMVSLPYFVEVIRSPGP